jgi:large subunit ribosomal protein L24
MRKVKKGDTVLVTAGREKGKKGKVLFIKDEHITIEGINVVKKFVKKNVLGKNTEGSIIDFEKPIHISNVKVILEGEEMPARIGFKMENGKKVRFAKPTKMTAIVDKTEKKITTQDDEVEEVAKKKVVKKVKLDKKENADS